jgi:cardiolipin synthase A/B
VHRYVKRGLLGVLGLVVLLFALIGVLVTTRGTPVEHVITPGPETLPPGPTDAMFVQTMELFSRTHLDPTNQVEVLANGNETFPRLWRDLSSAKRSITVQMYYALPGTVADTLATILVERAKAGVRVLVLFDAFGSQRLEDEWFARLRAGGVRIEVLRPLHWYTLDRASHRSHVRVVVVDGLVGYTGGFGIDDKWLGDGRTNESWRDMNARFEGPAVMQLQAAFAASWAEATGELITGGLYFPPAGFDTRGGMLAGLLYSAPTVGSTPAERFLAVTIASARRTLYVANSYFVPDDDFRRLLIDAAQRGVDVRILTASEKTDIKTTLLAGRSTYEELLSSGIRIYEYQPSMMHSKTIVVDGLWSSVGSLNFDNRSLALNTESNLVVLDGGVGAVMDSLFLQDLTQSREIQLPAFRQRSWISKVLEKGARLLARVL